MDSLVRPPSLLPPLWNNVSDLHLTAPASDLYLTTSHVFFFLSLSLVMVAGSCTETFRCQLLDGVDSNTASINLWILASW